MNKIIGFLLIIGAVLLGVWYWRKNYKQSPLDIHFADLSERAATGNLNQAAAYASAPPLAMLGEGWATATIANKNNSWGFYNTPQKTRFQFRFAQPT